MQINEEIKAKEVRLIGENQEQLGIVPFATALETAYDRGLDLVLIAPTATPPVCRIMDYGRYRYEQDKKEKESKKKQTTVEIKEIQLSCRIDTHDFNTKATNAIKFLTAGNKVRVVLKYKWREITHQEIGRDLLKRFEEACAEVGTVDKPPVLDGRIMTMFISPKKA